MIAKLTGAVFILITGVFLGNFFAEKITNNKKMLQDIVILLNEISNNIFYKNDDVLTAFKNAEKFCNFEIFHIAEFKNDYLNFLNDTIKQESIQKNLSKKQQNMFYIALQQIGTHGKNTECEKLEYYINFFKNEIQITSKKEETDTRLYKALGLYGGIAAAIFII